MLGFEWNPFYLSFETSVIAGESQWRLPLKWNEQAKKAGERHRVFCGSMCDFFEDWRGEPRDATGAQLLAHSHRGPFYKRHTGNQARQFAVDLNACRARVFDLIDRTPHLDWLLLTKRPENIRDMWPKMDNQGAGWMLKNVWLGCSVSEQQTYEQNLPYLLACHNLAPVLFLSAEPLLGPIDLRLDECDVYGDCYETHERLTWVIVGGESGPNARPCAQEWIREIAAQCDWFEKPCFIKQLGDNSTNRELEPCPDIKSKKGGDINEWPIDLRIRQFPRLTENRV